MFNVDLKVGNTLILIYLNRRCLLKSFWYLRPGFESAIYDDSRFYQLLMAFGAFEMRVHVK